MRRRIQFVVLQNSWEIGTNGHYVDILDQAMDEQDQNIQTFASLTGSSPEQARVFLEANGWQVEAAMDLWFASQHGESSMAHEQDPARQVLGAPALGTGSPVSTTAPSLSAPRPTKEPEKKRFGSLRDFREDEGESDPDKPHDFFTGGEKSGLAVENPNKDKRNIIQDILQKAAQGGREGPPSDSEDEGTPQGPKFTGTGYTLGSDEQPGNVVTPQEAPSQSWLPRVDRVLTFWRDGFSVGDGPLYRYDDPAHQATLAAINSGRAPLSILNIEHGQSVNVQVEKKLDEEYKAPKAKLQPFGGRGQRLGSVVPGASSPAPSAPVAAAGGSEEAAKPASGPQLHVDNSQATTSLQIRLGDGTRMVSRFNETHTVDDIYNFVAASRTDGRPFKLMTTFPNKELTERSQTLKEANLVNAVVVQRFM